eukprot:1196236-Prorocentrum_minimum.AAC.1
MEFFGGGKATGQLGGCNFGQTLTKDICSDVYSRARVNLVGRSAGVAPISEISFAPILLRQTARVPLVDFTARPLDLTVVLIRLCTSTLSDGRIDPTVHVHFI